LAPRCRGYAARRAWASAGGGVSMDSQAVTGAACRWSDRCFPVAMVCHECVQDEGDRVCVRCEKLYGRSGRDGGGRSRVFRGQSAVIVRGNRSIKPAVGSFLLLSVQPEHDAGSGYQRRTADLARASSISVGGVRRPGRRWTSSRRCGRTADGGAIQPPAGAGTAVHAWSAVRLWRAPAGACDFYRRVRSGRALGETG